MKILLTGATGYIGGRLLRSLSQSGADIRSMCRDTAAFSPPEGCSRECAYGDVLQPDSLTKALEGVDVAYYLIHSMGDNGHFERLEAEGAKNFAAAAQRAGVRRIVYLGGLYQAGATLSPHMRSRAEVGRILRASGIEVIEFRASIVIGSGSLSFQLIASLVRRLPVMLTPRWVRVQAQPIAVEDLIDILAASRDRPFEGSQVIDIAGPDIVRYRDLLQIYARATGRRRLLIPLPFLTPWLSSLWLGLVTPIYARVGRKLIGSMRHPSVATHNRAAELLGREPMGVEEAVVRAIANEGRIAPETRWLDSRSASGVPLPKLPATPYCVMVDDRSITVDASSAEAFEPIRRIGGESGWYCGNWLWTLRGWLDLLCGGVGMRRGRPDADSLTPGDVLDFWRVEEYDPNGYLRLRAEMKLPGTAWLELKVEQDADGTRIQQKATVFATPVLGRLYWYAVSPLHHIVFGGMLRRIAAMARAGRKEGGDERGLVQA
jgi:uncharacterized protein YbjT (DUF2867 family)